jgi:flavin reductase (DIM6/NTAB) family NADH-FMN oxidoreductase RutF
MIQFTSDDLRDMDRFYRANLLSSMSGIKPAMLVGTINKGISNLAMFQNIVHLGANPALIGIINRPREATTHTLENIEQTGWFTLNSVHASFVEAAHKTSAKYDAGISEFEETGLTPFYAKDIPVPFVKESHLKLALQLEEIVPIKQNGTFLIIGKVVYLQLPDSILQQDGFVDIENLELVCSSGLDSYYSVKKMSRLSYAKPGKPIAHI